jgi:hypothetical protein
MFGKQAIWFLAELSVTCYVDNLLVTGNARRFREKGRHTQSPHKALRNSMTSALCNYWTYVTLFTRSTSKGYISPALVQVQWGYWEPDGHEDVCCHAVCWQMKRELRNNWVEMILAVLKPHTHTHSLILSSVTWRVTLWPLSLRSIVR